MNNAQCTPILIVDEDAISYEAKCQLESLGFLVISKKCGRSVSVSLLDWKSPSAK